MLGSMLFYLFIILTPEDVTNIFCVFTSNIVQINSLTSFPNKTEGNHNNSIAASAVWLNESNNYGHNLKYGGGLKHVLHVETIMDFTLCCGLLLISSQSVIFVHQDILCNYRS